MRNEFDLSKGPDNGASDPPKVPEKALHPKTDEGREWWGKVADGSVILDPQDLDTALKKIYESNGQNH